MEIIQAEKQQTTSAELARGIYDEVDRGMPAEKARANAEMDKVAEYLQEKGSDHVEGRGQLAGEIPLIVYTRWALAYPGCWQDAEFVHEFLKDNPRCCAVGYRPKASGLRHSFTMGKAPPIGAMIYRQNLGKVAQEIAKATPVFTS